MHPKLSIITICYNEPNLRRTCESIVNQKFQEFEWIVIDGGSNAETMDVFKQYRDRINIFVSEKDNGIYDAINKGIARASGEYLNFMNAGDCLANDEVLGRVALELRDDDEVLYGYSILDGNIESWGARHYEPLENFTKNGYRWLMTGLPHQATFFNRKLFEEHGVYDGEKYPVFADWAFNMKLWNTGRKFRFIDRHIAMFNHNGLSAQSYHSLRGCRERYDMIRENFSHFLTRFEFRAPRIANILYRALRFITTLHRPWRDYFRAKYKCAEQMMQLKKSACEGRPSLLFIAHSYHKKTRSCDFMAEILRREFDVEIIYDESWQTGVFDISQINSGLYDYVVFWQNIPTDKKTLRRLRHKKMFWFPMWDGIAWMSDRHLRRCARRFRIISFCKFLSDKLAALHIDSLYVKYFPKYEDNIKIQRNDLLKIFFWQRTNFIDINKVIAAIGRAPAQIHIHKSIDPNCEFVAPTAEQEKKYNITYSDWFPSRADIQNKIAECDIFIAPREFEGIGMSFLEAMAMGRAVIAHDAPTMNEYIKNGETGYLVDFHNPAPVDFSNIAAVQKNAYDAVIDGRARWSEQRGQIIGFIKGAKKTMKLPRKVWKLLKAGGFANKDSVRNEICRRLQLMEEFTQTAQSFETNPSIFSKIYDDNSWNSDESRSGGGSEIDTTAVLREFLPRLWDKYKIKSILDIPCGDYNWMRLADKTGIDYTGADIVPHMIARNQKEFGAENVRFRIMDLTRDELPAVDMIFCKDCLQHLSENNVKKALANIKRSKAKWLLVTSYPLTLRNWDINDGDYRPLNLHAGPFYMNKFREFVQERPTENLSDIELDKMMFLYKIQNLPDFDL